MAPHDISLSDAKLHLSNLAAPMKARNLPFVIELRCLQKGSPPRSWRVDPYNEQMIDSALEAVSRLNSGGYNIYTTVNPLCTGGEIWKTSTDEEVNAATYLVLGADEEGVAKNIIEKQEVTYDFLVVTGTEPYLRAHFNIQLGAPTERISDWRLVMDKMITAHSFDKSAKNLSRVMRLASFFNSSRPRKNQKKIRQRSRQNIQRRSRTWSHSIHSSKNM